MLVHVAASKKISDAKTKAAGIDIDRQNADDEVHVIRRMNERKSFWSVSRIFMVHGYHSHSRTSGKANHGMEWNGMEWGTLDFNFLMIWTVHATLNM